MPNLEWIIFTEVKYETLSIPIPILEGCLVSLFAGLEQWNEPWNGLKQNINFYLFFCHSNTLCYVPTNSALYCPTFCLLLKVVGVKKTHAYYMASM